MSTNTSNTSNTSSTSSTSSGDSTVRPGLRTGEQVVAVQCGAWGPQEVTVRAYSDGGAGERPTSPSGSGPA